MIHTGVLVTFRDHTSQWFFPLNITDHVAPYGTMPYCMGQYRTPGDNTNTKVSIGHHRIPWRNKGDVQGHIRPCRPIKDPTMSIKAKQGYRILYGTIWDHTKTYGTIQDNTGPYGTIHDHSGLRDHTRPYETIRDHTGPYGIIRDHMGHYRTIRVHTSP